MNKLNKVMDDVVTFFLGDMRSGDDRRVKKPRKRKYEKRKAGVKSNRRKK